MATNSLINTNTNHHTNDHNNNDHANHAHHDDATSKSIFGFWIYIMSDCILFACIFATYIVLMNATYGGPGAKELFHMPYVLGETFLLLISSFTYGIAMLNAHKNHVNKVIFWMIVTLLFGLGFLIMELNEFYHLIIEGHTWSKSAYLSAFFTLVGTHGLHVTCGIIWIILMLFRLSKRGINQIAITKLTCLGLFWHFLDIVWIFVFTIVYLVGAI